jgi:hypothetical protein
MKLQDFTKFNTLELWRSAFYEVSLEGYGNTSNLAHQDSIVRCAMECDVIKEIGVCQGGSLSAMMLTDPKKLTAIDINPINFNPYKSVFQDYADRRGIDFTFMPVSSLDPSTVSPCEMLHIDSLHTPDHLWKELNLHAATVSKYIIMHDTCNFKTTSGLLPVIAKYITEVEQCWQIDEHYMHRVGHTVLKRVERIPYE